jgi:hypothetical protein
MPFKTTALPAGAEMHVVTYTKETDGGVDILYITCPELGAAISVIPPTMRKVLMAKDSRGELFVRFMTHAVDMELREDDTQQTTGNIPLSMQKLNSLFLSEVGPVDQAIIGQCVVASMALIGTQRESMVITYSDAIYTAPDVTALLDGMDSDKLLAYLSKMMERDVTVDGGFGDGDLVTVEPTTAANEEPPHTVH